MKLLKRLRIGPKLLLAPGLMLLLLLALSAAAWVGMQRQNASMEHLVQVRAARMRMAADVAGEAKAAHAGIYQLLAWINGSFAQQRVDGLVAELQRKHASVARQLTALADLAEPDERHLLDASAAALTAYRKGVQDTIEIARVDQSIATNAMVKAESQFVALDAQLASLALLEKTLSEQAYADARAEFRSLCATMATLVLLSIGLSLLVTMLVRRAMLADIRAIADVVGELAAGRLTAHAASDGRDEIADTARALDSTIATLNDTVRTITTSVHSIDTASREIATGNLDLSNRTERQAGSLQQTASALEVLARAVKDTAHNAQRANELAGAAAHLADNGGRAVGRAMQTMESIRASARKMSDIIGVIDGIAFQTNILALNAAVEAARAGEHGRGFAVVAAEVGHLAQRCATAAREVKTLITTSSSAIDGGSAQVMEAGGSMGDIVAAVREVNGIIERISVASAEQADGIAEVNQAVGQMDGMTQQNAALVEQAAAAAASLHEQATNLARAVAIFHTERRAPDSPMRGQHASRPEHPVALAARRAS